MPIDAADQTSDVASEFEQFRAGSKPSGSIADEFENFRQQSAPASPAPKQPQPFTGASDVLAQQGITGVSNPATAPKVTPQPVALGTGKTVPEAVNPETANLEELTKAQGYTPQTTIPEDVVTGVTQAGEGLVQAAHSGLLRPPSRGPLAQPPTPEQLNEATKGATNIVEGATTAGTPLLATTPAAPLNTAIGLGLGYGASKLAGYEAQKHGASPETQQLLQDVAFFIPSAVGHLSGLAEPSVRVNPEVGAVGEAFPETNPETGAPIPGTGRVAAGVAKTPEGVQVAGKVGPFKGKFTVPGTAPKAAAPGIEPPTIDMPPMDPETAAATQSMARAQAAKSPAELLSEGKAPSAPPPVAPPPPPPPMVNDATAAAVATAIKQAPPEQQPALILEATKNAAVAIQHHGGAVVDGEVHTASTPEQAQKIATKIINAQIEAHDAEQTNEPTAEKTTEVTPTDRARNAVQAMDEAASGQANAHSQQEWNQAQDKQTAALQEARSALEDMARERGEQPLTLDEFAKSVYPEWQRRVDKLAERIRVAQKLGMHDEVRAARRELDALHAGEDGLSIPTAEFNTEAIKAARKGVTLREHFKNLLGEKPAESPAVAPTPVSSTEASSIAQEFERARGTGVETAKEETSTTPVSPKHPWEMTLGEALGKRDDEVDWVGNRDPNSPAGTAHRDAVEQAIADGKPVPSNVLKDYPWLEAEQNIKPYVESLRGMSEDQLNTERKLATKELNKWADGTPALLPDGTLNPALHGPVGFGASAKFNAVEREFDARKAKTEKASKSATPASTSKPVSDSRAYNTIQQDAALADKFNRATPEVKQQMLADAKEKIGTTPALSKGQSLTVDGKTLTISSTPSIGPVILKDEAGKTVRLSRKEVQAAFTKQESAPTGKVSSAPSEKPKSEWQQLYDDALKVQPDKSDSLRKMSPSQLREVIAKGKGVSETADEYLKSLGSPEVPEVEPAEREMGLTAANADVSNEEALSTQRGENFFWNGKELGTLGKKTDQNLQKGQAVVERKPNGEMNIVNQNGAVDHAAIAKKLDDLLAARGASKESRTEVTKLSPEAQKIATNRVEASGTIAPRGPEPTSRPGEVSKPVPAGPAATREVSATAGEGRSNQPPSVPPVPERVEGGKTEAVAPQWKYEEYGPFSRQLAKDYTRAELEKKLGKLEGEQTGNTASHLRAIERSTSMQSNAQARAQSGNVVRGNYEQRQYLKNAIELYDYYPEQTKEYADLKAKVSQLEAKRAEAAKPAISVSRTLRVAADAMQSQIEAKRNPGVANQNPTARRARQADNSYHEAERLEKIQKKTVAIADAIDNGTLPESLAGVRNRAQVESLLTYKDLPKAGIHKALLKTLLEVTKSAPGTKDARAIMSRVAMRDDQYPTLYGNEEIAAAEKLLKVAESRGTKTSSWNYDFANYKRAQAMGLDTPDKWEQARKDLEALGGNQPARDTKAEDLRKLERDDALTDKAPGSFPTPRPLAARLVKEADIKPGMSVLEPSAGKGNIADAVRDAVPDAKLDTIEPQGRKRSILELKGHNLVGSDFLDFKGGPYDRIVMNPPFERGADATHVEHAYELLKPGGRLVAIMSEGTFFRETQIERGFRDWLDEVGGTSEQLPAGSFTGKDAERQTGVASRMVVIDKPAEKAATQTPDWVNAADLDRLNKRIEQAQAKIEKSQPIVDAPQRIPGPYVAGPSKYTMGKQLDAENNRRSAAFTELQQAKKDVEWYSRIRDGYLKGENWANGQPRKPGQAEARAEAHERNQAKIEAQGFDTRKIHRDLNMDGESKLADGRTVSYEMDADKGYRYKITSPSGEQFGEYHPSISKMQDSGELRKLLASPAPVQEEAAKPAEEIKVEGDRKTELEQRVANNPDVAKLKPETPVEKGKNFEGRYLRATLEPVKQAWMDRVKNTNGDSPENHWKWMVKTLTSPSESGRPDGYKEGWIFSGIPDDGAFLIPNTPKAIDHALKSAARFGGNQPTKTLPKPKEFKVPKPTEEDRQRYIKGLEDDLKTLQSELEHSTKEALQRTKERDQRTLAELKANPHERGNPRIGWLEGSIKGTEGDIERARTAEEVKAEIELTKENIANAPQIGETTSSPETPAARRSSEAGFATPAALSYPLVAPIKAAIRLNDAYDSLIDKGLQKAHMGRQYPEIEKEDPETADALKAYAAGPQYIRAKVEHALHEILSGLDRDQEWGLKLMADKESRDWLNENHHDLWLKYSNDPKIQEALKAYKPYEIEMREARRAMGGAVIEDDYLKRTYYEHVAGIGKPEKGKTSDKAAVPIFDRVVTPQMVSKKHRVASPEYYYEHASHEFGPAFATQYMGTMMKLLEHRAAATFISKATKLDPGDALPAKISYAGKDYYSPEMARMIREGKNNPAEGKEIAEQLGIDQLPKPSEIKEYSIYSPQSRGKTEYMAKNLAAEVLKSKEGISDEVRAAAGQLHTSLSVRYLGPKDIVEAFDNDGKHVVPAFLRSLGDVIDPITGVARRQAIGLGFGVPHIFNILRRVMQANPLAQANPMSWGSAAKVAFSKELRNRAIEGVDDQTFDTLLSHAGISDHGIEGYHAYLETNFDDPRWKRAWALVKSGAKEFVENAKSLPGDVKEAYGEGGAKGIAKATTTAAARTVELPIRPLAYMGHHIIFSKGGIDQRARLWLGDLIKSQNPNITDQQIAEAVNEQLGRYNKASWTDFQRDVRPFTYFPGWDYSSVNWVLRHPLRTTLPAAFLVLLANQILHRLGKNDKKGSTDMNRLHVGGRAYSTNLMRERFSSSLLGFGLRAGSAKLAGQGNEEAIRTGMRGLPGDAGAFVGMLNPIVSAPVELRFGKEMGTGKDIVPQGDWKKSGKPEKDYALYGARKLFPAYTDAAEAAGGDKNARTDWRGFIGRNLGVPNYPERKKR